MDLGIAGKWALVCGASKGLGFGCAQALVREGVNVVINARQPDVLQQAASKLIASSADTSSASGQNGLKSVVLAVAADITTPEGRAAVFSAPGGPGHDFDIVVTNAGGPPAGDFRDWERADWLRAIDANMLTPIELIKATVDGMAARGFGRVVNITSSAVKEPMNVLGLSNGARSGLTGFIAGLARSKIAAQGVTINNLLPGKFATERLGVTFEAMGAAEGVSGEQIRQGYLQKIPAHRLGTPEEFGAICAFLCSVHAGFITGQNVLADGGAYPGTF
ncbi:SDR family oxidoreductase [Extensimonas sp. H3M7-6]|uniref:SDR family oxidoreductase n=1 Tax=Extensimonas soli TaxID=3031322 RepID=UPI0023D9FCF2|nr:SDR family oxidoreductase [Extensimonas sp. H3M7-6]MDF1481948.1 SDR family oxidoreductase [Extensimonas sp. H3M7-6]